jgi:uncharacterized protein YceH (UPF0502 family)
MPSAEDLQRRVEELEKEVAALKGRFLALGGWARGIVAFGGLGR